MFQWVQMRYVALKLGRLMKNKRKILLLKERHLHFEACQNYRCIIRFDKLTIGFNTQDKNTLHYKLVSTFIMRYHLDIHMD